MKNATKDNNITAEKIQNKLHLFNKGKNSRIPELLYMRLNGITLREIGEHFLVTQGRIRQMEAKGIEILRSKNIPLKYVGDYLPKEVNDNMKIRVEDLFLSTRTVNTLYNNNVRTVGGLTRKTKQDFLDMEGIGEKAVCEIRNCLLKMNLMYKAR
jgi:DNA-directed RNA polymerase alpha subunit